MASVQVFRKYFGDDLLDRFYISIARSFLHGFLSILNLNWIKDYEIIY